MSMPFVLESEVCRYDGRVIRIVEAQHLISTNRLATNAADQALLEVLADEVKPALPAAARNLPWLLASPFRYGLGRPSRFRSGDVLPGIFYASEDIETAVTEAAYWRLAAFSRSPGFRFPRTPTPMSAFSVVVRTARAIDLSIGVLSERLSEWTHPSDYTATHALSVEARLANVAAIRAPSARRNKGINIAILDPAALVPPPRSHSSWAFMVSTGGLLATQELGVRSMRFTAEQFGL
jgi:RES domain